MPQAIYALSVQIMSQANLCPQGQFMMARIDNFLANLRYRACSIAQTFCFSFGSSNDLAQNSFDFLKVPT